MVRTGVITMGVLRITDIFEAIYQKMDVCEQSPAGYKYVLISRNNILGI